MEDDSLQKELEYQLSGFIVIRNYLMRNMKLLKELKHYYKSMILKF